ncbi:MAG: hypothetical protein JNM95_06230 [Chitinophagaceae bacterium]|nr:hypothetical protein [Chitinophagaceae bacterium]
MPRCLILNLFFLVLFSQEAKTKELSIKYEHFAVENGLPSQTVYAAHEDHQGFLWISTDAGVSRFDGHSFTNFSVEDGLGDNEIVDFSVDSKGRIWFFPFSGSLSYFLNGKFYNIHNQPVLKKINASKSLIDFVEAQNGDLYFCFRPRSNSIIVLNNSNEVDTLNFQDVLNKNYINHIFLNDKKEVILLISDGSLYNIQTKEKSCCFLEPGMPGVDNFYAYNQQVNYTIDHEGLKRLSSLKPTLLIPSSQLPDLKGYVRICEDAHGNIWVSHATLHTLIFFKKQNGYHEPVKFLDNLSAKVCFDTKNNAWLCSPIEGLFKVPSYMLHYEILKLNQQLHGNRILSTYLDTNNTYWLGYSDGFVDHVNGLQVKAYDLGFGTRTYNRVLDLQMNARQELYVILDEGGMRLLPSGKKEHCDPYGIRVLMAGKTIVHDFRNHILFGYAECLAGFKEDSVEALNACYPFIDSTIRHFNFFIDSFYRMYDSRSDGLHFISVGRIENLALHDKRLNTRINHFLSMKDGSLLLATYGEGVLVLEKNRVRSAVTRLQGLPGILCRRIYNYHDTLYVSTNGGISVLTYFNRSLRWIRNITQADGLITNDINSVFILNRVLYAAGANGLSVLPLEIKPANTAAPVVSVLSLRFNGKNYSWREPITLPFSKYHIQIDYVAPNLAPEHRIKYRYKIKASQATWFETYNISVDLSNLPADNYLVEIQARYEYSPWSASAKIPFCIAKPFYQTWWFLLLLLVGLGSGIYLITRALAKRKLRRKLDEIRLLQALERERSRIAADIHDDIGAELTNIVLLSQQGKIAQQTETVLEKLETAADTLMNKMNEVIWSLNHNNDTWANLIYFIRDYIIRFEDNCSVKVTFGVYPETFPDLAISAQARRNIFLVVKEALLNIYKYAGVQEAQVKFSLEKQQLSIQIKDHGKGFEMNKYNLNGNGIKNMQKRVQELQGDISFNSLPGKGTTITIKILL